MKKALAWLLVIAMTAAISIGGTLAYLTDTDEDVNVMTVGQVKIDQLEYERVDVETNGDDAKVQEFHDNKPLYPAVTDKDFNYTPGTSYVDWDQIGKDGYTSDIWDSSKINNEVDKMVFVKNKGDWDAYVRTVFAFEAGNYTNLTDYLNNVHLNLNETDWTWKWVETPITIGEGSYFVATATYNEVLKPGAITEISLSQIALDSSVTNEDVAGFGDTYQVLVQSQAVQVAGFTDADTALNEAFGVIDVANAPFENDNPYRGTDLKTALHNLNGDTSTAITKKVSTIIYDHNKNYPEIVSEYKGTLIDVEQDMDVYAYYVPDGTNYTVYILSNDTIYAPRDSSFLMANMSSLTYVDTSNFDVSRAQTLKRMFYGDTKLAEVDVSQFDTSNVTDMNGVFFNCKKLKEINANGWDTSRVTDLYAIFYNCQTLKTLDLNDWDTGNVECFEFVFSDCKNLDTLNIHDWDLSNGTSFDSFLQNVAYSNANTQITSLDLNHWDLSNAKNLSHFFYGMRYLQELHIDQWDISKATNADHMFSDCVRLKTLDLSGWNPASLENMNCMFNDLDSLTTLDVSCFAVSPLVDLGQTFESMNNLEQIIGLETWNTSKVFNFQQMFQGSGKLKEIDLSGFDTSSATDVRIMFNGCSGLETIYVGDGWDMSNVTKSRDMFTGCKKLVGGNGTTFDSAVTDVTYACVDTTETPGYLTHISQKPAD